MGKYYVYCTKNQAYHALLENAILSNALTKDTFQARSLSFLSRNFIFITKDLVSPDMMMNGCTDIYYPVVFEIECHPETQSIPVYLMRKNENASPTVSDTLDSLSNYNDICIGAFVFGEIPLSMISGILFLNDSNLRGFYQPAPDLWNPEHLYRIIPTKQPYTQVVTNSEIEKASKDLDTCIKEKADMLNMLIHIRLKQKAEAYFLIDGTDNWEAGKLKGNIDGYLKTYLRNEKIDEEINRLLATFKDSDSNQLLRTDSILTIPSETLDARIFDSIKRKIEEENESTINFASLKTIILEESSELKTDLDTIENFVYKHTIQNPEKAYSKIKHIGFKALAVFLANQNDERLLKNACRRLTQEERRYAYILFAAHHGMKAVSGEKKKNEKLERWLEEITYVTTSECPEIICNIPNSTKDCGFVPNIVRWFEEDEARSLLTEKASDTQIETLCQSAWNKYSEIDECYEFVEPITFTVRNAADFKEVARKVQKLRKSISLHQNMKLTIPKARDILSNSKIFSKIYKSHSEQIQQICREILG